MDVPLALTDIEIHHGLKGYKGKSSTFSQQADVVGLSALVKIIKLQWLQIEKLYHKC